jgi:N-acetylglucosamine-6-phosphate deacetylase
VIVLSGADLVLPDRILSQGTLVIENGRIVEIRSGGPAGPTSSFAFHGHYIVPGFIDVHVHGIEGVDSLGAGSPIAAIAERLPRFGVTAFCPTTVACAPDALSRVLEQVRRAREMPIADAARVLPAHLESNFINPQYRGAQPPHCLRTARLLTAGGGGVGSAGGVGKASIAGGADFDAADVLQAIETARPDVGIVTVAPEIEGGLDLIAWLVSRDLRVSLGHSGATYDEALAAIGAGARHATHLFNRMPPLDHRRPGLAGAILQADEVAAELICDGVHVHPAMIRTAVAAKGRTGIMAITDSTAAAGLPVGTRARLGDQRITAGESAALLDDGTLAGSVLTMNRAFEMLVNRIGLSPVDAATMCATTPARQLGLVGHGVIAQEAIADLAVLDSQFSVVQTYVAGQLVYSATEPSRFRLST